MAKLLDRLSGVEDKEVQEDTKKEEEMTKPSKYDLDLDKLKGETKTTPPKTPPKIPTNPFDTLKGKKTPMESFAPPKARSTPKPHTVDQFNETWICYVEDGKLEQRELKSCTPEEFGKWLSWVYPPSKEFLKKNEHLYEKFENREQEFKNIVKFLTVLPKHFEKGSHQETMRCPKKEEEK